MHSQPAWRTLLVAILFIMIADEVAAQTEATVTAENEWFYDSPDGKRLARLSSGATVTAGRIEGDWQEVTLEGWIFTPSVEITARSGFDLRVSWHLISLSVGVVSVQYIRIANSGSATARSPRCSWTAHTASACF